MDPGSDSVFAANPEEQGERWFATKGRGISGAKCSDVEVSALVHKKTASPVRRVLKGGAVLVRERKRERQAIPKIIKIEKDQKIGRE